MNRRRIVIVGACVAALAMLVSVVSFLVSAFTGGAPSATPSFAPPPASPWAPPPAGSAAPSTAPSGAPATAAPPADTVPQPGGGPARIGWWQPRGKPTWQWQLTGKVDTSVAADVYDVDGAKTTRAEVTALRTAGRRTICYVNVGAFENFRADKGRFPESVKGKTLDGWPDEKWLDIRRWDVLEPILRDRFKDCRQKGFDGVEPDNVDGYSNKSGFPLTAGDQLTFNRRLADLAHQNGLAVGLKNNVEQAASLVPWFDFAVSEECSKYHECDELRVFTAQNKPVFHVEYDLAVDRFCPESNQFGFSSMRKRLDLDAWRQPC